MITISTQQAKARLKTLPENLWNVLFSDQTAEIIYRIGEQYHLTEEKISKIAEVVGIAILGFIHPEELSKEIQERAHLPPELVKNIVLSLENRIFGSIRQDLEKIYAPLRPEQEKTEGIKEPPTPVPTSETIMPQSSKPAPRPLIDLSSLTKTIPPSAPQKTTTPTIPPVSPAPLSTPPLPKTIPPKPTAAPAQATPVPITKIPPAPPSSAPPAPPPVLLKRKLELEPIKSPAGVRIESSAPFAGTGKTSVTAPPPKPARIEVGKPQPPPPPPPKISPPSPPLPAKIVHYSQWRTPIQPASPTTTPTPSPPPPAPPAASKQGTPNIPTAPLRPTPPTPPPGDKSSLPPIPPK